LQKKLVDGEQVRIHIPKKAAEGLCMHECCDCGLQHNLYVGIDGRYITLAFVRIPKQKDKKRSKREQGKDRRID